MSFNDEELKLHCQTILRQQKIRDKLVVLCEGVIPKEEGRLSPQSYGRMETLPDANFYKACIPTSWKVNLPQFFNCGDRNNVLSTYFALSEMLNSEMLGTDNSYYYPKKIFALVDLDIQIKTIDNYRFKDTQQIFCNLYEKSKINEANAEVHEILITGLIHKESYFLVPELQSIFNKYLVSASYKNTPLLLDDIYDSMSDDLIDDVDIIKHFGIVCSRINHCAGLDFNDIESLKNSLKTELHNAKNNQRKQELVFSLLTIKKAKDYWHQIQPSIDWNKDSAVYRDLLSLAIAKEFYAKQTDNDIIAQYHIPYFLKMLRKLID